MFLGVGLGALLVMLVAIWLLLRSSAAAETPASTGPTALPGPVATVNGVAISRDMIEREVKVSRLNLLEPLPPLSGDDLTRARQEALNQITTRQLILQAAARDGFSLDDDFIQRRVDLIFGTYGDEVLGEAMAIGGVERDDLWWWVSELTIVEEYTVRVIMAEVVPENRQRVYNDWLNNEQARATIQTFLDGSPGDFTALPGNPAPNFSLNTTSGQIASLADYRGQIVLVNFWATWCPSCISEMPDYEAVYQAELSGGDFVVLGINLQENPERVAEFAAGLGLTFPILLDRDGDVTIKNYQMVGMPGSIIVDRQGVIFYRHIGPMSGQVLLEKLNELK